MSERTKIVAILGITGRLGPALARRFSDWEVRGLSRRSAREDEDLPAHTQFFLGSRQDPALLAEIMEGADTVIDCVAFSQDDASILIEACSRLTAAPKHLIYVSSIAECGPDQIGCSEDEAHRPTGGDGLEKRKARLYLDQHFNGIVHSFILPRLVATVDHHRREQPYLSAASSGPALVAGTGEQLQVMAPVEGVATVAWRLSNDPMALRAGMLNVGPPSAISVRKAVDCLLQGAERRANIARHPDERWRGPHGGGSEPLDTSLLQTTFPSLQWPDTEATFRDLGAWLAKNPDEKRPKALVKTKEKTFIGHGVVDIHRRRTDLQITEPRPELADIADWLTPAFYIDTGRPCNAACMYCAVPPHLDTQGFAPLDQLKRQVAVGKQAGNSRAILIGGEPTIHPDLSSILDELHETGLSPGHAVMTNGQKLSDRDFVDKLHDGGVRTIHLSIDTADAAVYDQIARTPGRSGKQWEAFRNVLRHEGLNLYIYTCVTQINAPGIPQLLETLVQEASSLNQAPPPVVCAFLKPIGDGLTHRGVLLQSFAERLETARKVMKKAKDLGIGIGFRNLQACLAPELVPYLVDYYIEDASLNLRTGQSETYAHGAYWRRVEACEACGHKEICPGVYCDDPLDEAAELFTTLDREGLS
jgi:MoaA/NifB/PqqE/SkfB family radical SAM enzyme/nucleoside-diphosphate-sugar epimerase